MFVRLLIENAATQHRFRRLESALFLSAVSRDGRTSSSRNRQTESRPGATALASGFLRATGRLGAVQVRLYHAGDAEDAYASIEVGPAAAVQNDVAENSGAGDIADDPMTMELAAINALLVRSESVIVAAKAPARGHEGDRSCMMWTGTRTPVSMNRAPF